MAKFKHAQTDFTKEMLPSTRKEVFFDILKNHFGKICTLALIMFVFALPINVSAISADFYQASLIQSYQAGTISAEELTGQLLSFTNTRGLVEILFFVLLGIGFSAVARVIRQFCWEENVWLKYDLVKGLQQNWLQYALLGLAVGIVRFGCAYMLNNMRTEGLFGYIRVIPTVLAVLLLAPMAAYASVTLCTYSSGLIKNLKVGFVLYIKYPLHTLGMIIACFAIYAVQLIPNIYCHIIGRIVSSLIIPIVMFVWFLYTYNRLDKSINPKMFPELVDKGLLGKGKGTLDESEETPTQNEVVDQGTSNNEK